MIKFETYHRHWQNTELMYHDGKPDVEMIFHRAADWSDGNNNELYAEAFDYTMTALRCAPEMLEALDKLDHYLTDLLAQTDSSALDNLEKARRGHCHEMNQARAAIAKATGK